MKQTFIARAGAWATLLVTTATSALAQTNPAPVATPWKPAWLTEASITFREGYDNNLFGSGLRPMYYPGSFTGPYAGSVLAEKDHGSFFEMYSPKVAFDLAKLVDQESALKAFALSYAPEFYTYNSAPSESYIAHRIGSTIATKCDNISFQLDESFVYIDGDKYGPTYPGKYYSAYGYAPARERREQWQDRTTVAVTYDQPQWFLRTTASLLDYNLKTDQMAVPTANAAYMNFVDRYDVNGGADVGYKVMTNFAFTLGYRAGHQYQQKLPVAVDPFGQTSSSDYQRLLFGFEGTPTDWLKVKLQAGPDFRNYGAKAPVRDSNPVCFYGEGSLTAAASKDDSFAFGYRHGRWVGSTGMLPADENIYDLVYKHQFDNQWSAKLGGRVQSSDYSCGEAWSAGNHNPETALTYYRNDWLFTYSAGIQYDITASLSVDVAYAICQGRNAQDLADLAKMPGSQLPASKRQYDDQTISMGAKYKF